MKRLEPTPTLNSPITGGHNNVLEPISHDANQCGPLYFPTHAKFLLENVAWTTDRGEFWA
jgi:hypothetical protein